MQNVNRATALLEWVATNLSTQEIGYLRSLFPSAPPANLQDLLTLVLENQKFDLFEKLDRIVEAEFERVEFWDALDATLHERNEAHEKRGVVLNAPQRQHAAARRNERNTILGKIVNAILDIVTAKAPPRPRGEWKQQRKFLPLFVGATALILTLCVVVFVWTAFAPDTNQVNATQSQSVGNAPVAPAAANEPTKAPAAPTKVKKVPTKVPPPTVVPAPTLSATAQKAVKNAIARKCGGIAESQAALYKKLMQEYKTAPDALTALGNGKFACK